MSAKEGRSQTFNRIVEASLNLCNQQGERVITTNHIARYMNISTGNLYYHFRSKEEIINELHRRYAKGMAECLNAAGELSASIDGMVAVMEKTLRHLWQFRFLQQGIPSMFPVNKALEENHRDFTHFQVANGVQKLFMRLREQEMLEGDDEQINFLAKHFLLIQWGWIVRPDITDCPQEDRSIVREGCRSLLHFLSPYVSPRFRAPFQRTLASLELQPA